MPKSGLKRSDKSQRFLARLLAENPERFEVEWERRLCSWTDEIRFRAGQEGLASEPVFAIVEKAHETLSACGEYAMILYGQRTRGFLENLCCKMLARQIGPEIYRLNQLLDRRHEASRTRSDSKGG